MVWPGGPDHRCRFGGVCALRGGRGVCGRGGCCWGWVVGLGCVELSWCGWRGRRSGFSGGGEGPALFGVGEAEGGESGEVGRGGEEAEVRGDAEPAAHAGAA